MAYGFTPQVDSVVARECSIVWQVDCDGDGGGGGGPGGKRVYWGQIASPPPTVFTETMFTNPASAGWSPVIGGYNTATKLTRNGTYDMSEPPSGQDWFPVFWFPNSLLAIAGNPLSLTVQGFPFPLNPLPNTSYQNLSIEGVPGKVFLAINANNGSFTGSNPFTVS